MISVPKHMFHDVSQVFVFETSVFYQVSIESFPCWSHLTVGSFFFWGSRSILPRAGKHGQTPRSGQHGEHKGMSSLERPEEWGGHRWSERNRKDQFGIGPT